MRCRLARIPIALAGVGAHWAAAQSALVLSPSPVVFCGRPGQAVSTIPVAISNPAGPVTFVVSGIVSEGNWLTADPSFATVTNEAKTQMIVGINGGSIPFGPGTYQGDILLADFDGARLGAIPVSMEVSAAGCGPAKNGMMFSSSGALTFQLPAGAMSGAQLNIFNLSPRTVTIIPTTTPGQKWLSTIGVNLNVVPGILQPTPLGVSVNAAGLGPGTYTANLLIDSSNFTSIGIPVTLTVGGAGTPPLSATPSPLQLEIPAGTATASAAVQLTNVGPSPLTLALSTDTKWLTVTPAAAVVQPNDTLALTAVMLASGLAPGLNKGNINVHAGAALFPIPVTAISGIESKLAATPNPVNMTGVSQVLTVAAESGLVSFSSTAFSSVNRPWLSVSPFSATAAPGMPAKITLTVQPALLPPGPALGVVTLKPGDGSAPLSIPVNVNAGTDSGLSVTPGQLAFTYSMGGAVPQSQRLDLTNAAATRYSVQASDWLMVSPASVTTPASVTVRAKPAGLDVGTYRGQIVFTNVGTGAQQTIPVTLAVTPPSSISTTPASLDFKYEPGAPIPGAQSVQVTATGSTGIAVITGALNGAPNFLTVTSSSASTPAVLQVVLNPVVLASLPAGHYANTVTISSPALAPQTVAVRLEVSPAPPRVDAIVNGASLTPGPVAPGEMVTIYGFGLSGALTEVRFDGVLAPLLYAGTGQINAIVPYEIAGAAETSVVVLRDGVASPPLPLKAVETAPAIFSATQTGSGQGAILNSDGTPNSLGNPALKGSVIQIFATGAGAFAGAVTGAVTPSAPPFPSLSGVMVSIGGQPAEIAYAGAAPGLISGILQVNAVVPMSAEQGLQTVVLNVGGNANRSQTITAVVQ